MRQRWQAAGIGAAMLAAVTGVASAADLPANTRTAANVDADKPLIENWVKGEFALLASGSKKGSDPRDDLSRQIETGVNVQPSSAFTHAYLDAVANEMPTLANSPDEQKRMLGAIVLYRLAVDAPTSPRLSPLVEKVIVDKSPAVCLWGIKAAGAMLPPVLNVPVFGARQHLTERVVTAVQMHPNVGPVVQDAYNALSLDDQANNKLYAVPATGYEACIEATNRVMEIRVGQYAKGLPPYPQAERIISQFFTRLSSANAIPAKLKADTVQQLVSLMSVSSDLAANGASSKNDLVSNVSVYASLLNILLGAGNKADSQLKAIAAIKPASPPANMTQMVGDAVSAIKLVPGYANLKDPPKPAATQQSGTP